MSKEVMKLALEALGEIEWSNNSQWQSDRAKVAITALQEALANQALDKMAENARELGLDYEPAKDNSNYRFDPPGLDPSHQKPVAWWIPKAKQFCLPSSDGTRPFAKAWEPLYTYPSAQQEPVATKLHEAKQAMLEALKNCVDLLATCFPDAPIDSCIGKAITKGNAAINKGEKA